MQRHYDEHLAREEREVKLAESANWTKEMIYCRYGERKVGSALGTAWKKKLRNSWVSSASTTIRMEDYFNQQLKVAGFGFHWLTPKEPYAILPGCEEGEFTSC